MINLANFATLFPFKSSNPSLSPLNTLLDSQDITLERLLDQQSFINEFKIQNPKLIQFMKYDKYKTLIEFVTVVGPEQDNKRSYKYPFVACQILTTQNNTPSEFFLPQKQIVVQEQIVQQRDVEQQIEVAINSGNGQDLQKQKQKEAGQELPALQTVGEQNNIQKDKEVLKKNIKTIKKIVKKKFVKKIKKVIPPLINDLFKYLEGQINYTLAGYFSRILTVLFTKKTSSLINNFFTSKKYKKIVDHVGSRSIAQIIIKFLTIDSLLFLNERQQLLDIILNRLSNSVQINAMGNLSFVLCDVIQKYASTIKTINGSKQMLAYIYSPTFCEKLVNNIISAQSDEIVANYNTPILLSSLVSLRNLLQNKQQTKNLQLNQKFQDIINFIKNNLGQSSALTQLFKQFFFKALQRLNIHKNRFQAFGFGRIKLIQILFFLTKYDFFNIQSVILQTNFISILFSLMKQYQLNNVLHNQMIKIITFILQLQQGSPLITHFLQQTNILNFLYTQINQDAKILQKIKKKQKTSRKGYIGHIVKLGQLLLKTSTTNNQIIPIFSDQKWPTIKQFIDIQSHQNDKNLAGFATRKLDSNNMLFNKQDILTLYHGFLIQTPVTTYPEPVQQPKQLDIQQTIVRLDALQINQQQIKKNEKQKKQQKQVVSVIVNQVQRPKEQKKADISIQKNEERKKQNDETAKMVEQQKLRQVEQGIQIYSNVKYWKQSRSIQFELEDLLNDLQ